MSINAFSETIKALAQSLQVSTLLPATLLVLVNAYIFSPHLLPSLDLASPPAVTILTLLILTVSYTLYAFNFPLIRLFEGYKWQGLFVLRMSRAYERHHFKQLQKQHLEERLRRLLIIKGLTFDPDKAPGRDLGAYARPWEAMKARYRQIERELDSQYPMEPALLPTRLGNVIAAFEAYPLRYGIDTIALWPRLVPVLKDTHYLDFVTQEKSVFDFLLNMWLAVLALGSELTCLFLYTHNVFFLGMNLMVTVGLTIVFYQGMIVAARQWGTTVRVAFDLYRHELHRRLGLRPVETFDEEYKLWQEVSSFLLYRRQGVWFQGFLSQAAVAEREAARGEKA
jgi:hypothetical protein